MRIALLPLDDRPVNVLFPQDVAQVAGAVVEVPPANALPKYRTPGETDQLSAWLLGRSNDPEIDHLVVSLDMLCYGGLIEGRIGRDSTEVALSRLTVLSTIRERRPDLKISAVSLVMRASNSYSAAEEPDYWSTFGKDLHQLGADIHRLGDQTSGPTVVDSRKVPSDVVADFSLRRLRNHVVNLSALRLVEEGTVNCLAVTADDTARFSAGSAEQGWIRHWMRFLPHANSVLMYPGADEVGAILVARAVAEHANLSIAVRVSCADPDGFDRIPPYENVPLTESILRQVTAAGAHIVQHAADVVLIVHAPDPDRHDMWNQIPPAPHEDAVDRTVEEIQRELAAGSSVALADVRYSNGCDTALVRKLLELGLLKKLTSFGGWNTAGNTIGGVIATAVASAVGTATGNLDPRAADRALLARVLDDYGYQSVVRQEIGPLHFPDHLPLSDDQAVATAESAIRARLKYMLDEELPFSGWSIGGLELPWRRSFEVNIDLRESGESPLGDDSFGEARVQT